MDCFHRAKQFAENQAAWSRLRVAGFLWATLLCTMVCASSARCQDSGSAAHQLFGKGAEIAVSVRDSTGEAIRSTVMVRIYKDGTTPNGEAATSRGRAVFLVTSLGEFTVVVEAAGYQKAAMDVSVPVPTRTEVDVVLRKDFTAAKNVGVPGAPVLAPKAKEAFEKGLQALSADKLGNAEKYVAEAMRLAPSHPDVLYAQGVLYLKQRKWPEAQSTLEKATQIDPNQARAFTALGMALLDQGKYGAAIAPLEQALRMDPAAGWETHWSLAKAYYEREQYEQALKTSRLALGESQGKAPQIELLVAQSLTAVGSYEDAAKALKEFVRQHGERPEAATARRWLERLTASGKSGASSPAGCELSKRRAE